MIKKALALILSLSMLFVFAACGASSSSAPASSAAPQSSGTAPAASTPAASADPIKIGFVGPLTGGTAQAGQAALNGAQLAADEINAKGGLLGRQVQIVPYDDQSSPEQSVTSTTKLIEVDKVVAILGSLHSGNVLAAGPVAEEYKIPVVSGGTSPTWLEQGFKYHFRSLGNSRLGTAVMTDYAVSQGWKKVAMIHSNDESGNNGAKEFTNSAEPKGIEIVTDETFAHGDRDFTGQFSKIFRTEPDAILTWGLGDDLGPVAKQLRQAGWKGPIIGPEGYSLPELVDIVGDSFYDVYFTSPYIVYDDPMDAPDPLMQEFLKNYKAKYGNKPESDNAYRSYDAMTIIGKAIENSGSVDGTAIRDAIENLDGFVGLAGPFDYKGNNGEGIKTVRLYCIQPGGKYDLVQ